MTPTLTGGFMAFPFHVPPIPSVRLAYLFSICPFDLLFYSLSALLVLLGAEKTDIGSRSEKDRRASFHISQPSSSSPMFPLTVGLCNRPPARPAYWGLPVLVDYVKLYVRAFAVGIPRVLAVLRTISGLFRTAHPQVRPGCHALGLRQALCGRQTQLDRR